MFYTLKIVRFDFSINPQRFLKIWHPVLEHLVT